MKHLLLILTIFFISLSTEAQQGEKKSGSDSTHKEMIVDAACGQCKFGLPGKSCDLAVRIGDTSYFVDGTTIDEHGNAHAEDGFCNAVRKAKVKGRVADNRFKVIRFELLPVTAKKDN